MIKRFIKYIFLKIKWRGILKFNWSARISFGSSFEGMNQIHPHTLFKGEMGYGSYIGPYCELFGKIGRFSSIAPFVRCNHGRHPYTYPFVSTAPCFFSLNPSKSQNGSTYAKQQAFEEYSYADSEKKYPIIIGNDCWIGEGVFFVGGIKISDGVVVLAHAVVTKDIPPYAIVGGVPAKIIGFRYSKEDIDFLLKIKWWNNSTEWFEKNWNLLDDFDGLKKFYKDTNH